LEKSDKNAKKVKKIQNGKLARNEGLEISD
jgi:hypothetical protein